MPEARGQLTVETRKVEEQPFAHFLVELEQYIPEAGATEEQRQAALARVTHLLEARLGGEKAQIPLSVLTPLILWRNEDSTRCYQECMNVANGLRRASWRIAKQRFPEIHPRDRRSSWTPRTQKTPPPSRVFHQTADFARREREREARNTRESLWAAWAANYAGMVAMDGIEKDPRNTKLAREAFLCALGASEEYRDEDYYFDRDVPVDASQVAHTLAYVHMQELAWRFDRIRIDTTYLLRLQRKIAFLQKAQRLEATTVAAVWAERLAQMQAANPIPGYEKYTEAFAALAAA